MDQLGDDMLISIFDKIHKNADKRSFSEVSKEFLKISRICSQRTSSLHVYFPQDFLHDILPTSPNDLTSIECYKPLSNTHMELIAKSCPKLWYLDLDLHQNFDSGVSSDFDDDGLCAVANACTHLSTVYLKRRLYISDVGVVSLVTSSRSSLSTLDLSGCVNVTDESVKAIGECGHIQSLTLQGCKRITDLGLEYLANGDLRNWLNKLDLAECDGISDDGGIFLKQLVNLTHLNLSGCGINVVDFGHIPYLSVNGDSF